MKMYNVLVVQQTEDESRMVKSWVSFVRSQLKFEGRSKHNGRGAFWCEVSNDLTWQQFKNRVEDVMQRWQKRGVVQDWLITDEEINVMFIKQGTKDNRLIADAYRQFYVRRRDMDGSYNHYWISFTIIHDE